jgi:hypothetical protein
MIHRNCQVVEIKSVNLIGLLGGGKKGGLKMEGKLNYVIENKWKEMSVFRP